jgi:predicted permease
VKTELSLRFFRLLLLLYPREFRAAYGTHMEEAFLATLKRRGSGPLGTIRAWFRVAWDTVVHAFDLRVRRTQSEPGIGSEPTAPPPLQPRKSPGLGTLPTDVAQDLRFTLRTLRKSPGFTLVAILITGLGISLTTLVFTTVNASFLRPIPHVEAPQEIVRISRELPSRPGRRFRLSYQDWVAIREQSTTVRDVVGMIPYQELMLRAGPGLDRQVLGGEVTANYFLAMGIPMVLGRGILPEDETSGTDVAVLGHATWTREFGGSREALGSTVRIEGRQHTVVGVAPPGLGFLSGEPVETAIWIPIRSRYKESVGWNALEVAGRALDPGTLSQVQAELNALASGLSASEPDRWTEAGGAIGLRAMTDRQARLDLVGGPRGVASILIYLVFIGLIMVITCSNVAALLLNRALKRKAETAIRLAVGAGRGRLVRQLLTESVLLFSLGGALALLLLHWGTRMLAAGWGAKLPAVATITMDFRVVSAAVAVTVGCGLVFGLAPALQTTRSSLAPALRGSEGGVRVSRFGLRNLLVLAQVTASMVLVATSALIVRDLQRAEAIEIGFDPVGVAVASVNLAHTEYSDEEKRSFREALLERFGGMPGAGNVALAGWVPLSQMGWTRWTLPDGYEPTPGESLWVLFNTVTPGYFDLVGMPLVAGRDFMASDDLDAPLVVVVNQAFARHYWPEQEVVGKRVALGEEGPFAEVVGVVRDAMYGLADLREGLAAPHLWSASSQTTYNFLRLHVEWIGAPGPVQAAMREEIRLLNPDLPIIELTTMEQLTGRALFEEKASAILFGGFSALALLLAALGVYGTMAHAVLERTRELGVRLAVGAAPGRVVGMVLGESLKLTTLGILAGIPLAILVAFGIRVLLVGPNILDPLYITGSVTVLVLAAAAASLAPALRAARTDPLLSLKSE